MVIQHWLEEGLMDIGGWLEDITYILILVVMNMHHMISKFRSENDKTFLKKLQKDLPITNIFLIFIL